LYTHFPNSHTQNPLLYYLELYNLFRGKVIFIAEDNINPIVPCLYQALGDSIDVRFLSVQDAYSFMLRAKNLATSGAGTFAISSAFCSKNLKNFYCTNIFIEHSLNPLMLKEQLNVFIADIADDKYFKVGEWNSAVNNIDKILNYKEDILFRRL
jgi:hypothetical protein